MRSLVPAARAQSLRDRAIGQIRPERQRDLPRTRIDRDRQMERRELRGTDLVEDDGDDSRLGTALRIGLREVHRPQDRGMEQRRDLHHAAAVAGTPRRAATGSSPETRP